MLRRPMRIPSPPTFWCPLLFAGAVAAQTTWVVPTAQPTIQAAITAAAPGDTVLVLPGTHVETIDLLGKAITVRSAGGAAVTTIDGNQAGSVVTFANGEPLACVLEGFTITNGLGVTVAGNGARATAGGIQCTNASPTIRSCVVTGNQGGTGVNAASSSTVAGTGGPGGILAVSSALRLIDCDVNGNVGGPGGAGIAGGAFPIGARGGAGGSYLAYSLLGTTPEIMRCRFTANTGGAGGGVLASGQGATGGNGGSGAIELYSAVAVALTDVALTGNHGGVGGTPTGASAPSGGLGGNGGFDLSAPFFGFGAVAMTNCVVTGNVGGNAGTGGTAYGGDGGGSTGGTRFAALATTIAGNSTGTPLLPGVGTGGLTLGGFMVSTAALRNCIAWGNTRGGLASDLYMTGIPATLENSDVGASTGTFLGTGDLSVDPLFASLAAGDIHLTAASPCRHAGAAVAGLPLFDLDGDARTIGPATDMGADEFDVFPGSREDFVLSLDVNGVFAAGVGATPATGGDVVTVRTTSAGGALANAFALLVVEPWLPPAPPAGPLGIPELHVPLSAIWLEVYPSGVGPSGMALVVPWPVGLGGFALRLQAVAVTPAARNGVFALSAARDLIL